MSVDHEVDHTVDQLPATQAAAGMPDEADFDDADNRDAMRPEERRTPFLFLLQAQSPQCVDGKPERIDEARAGMVLDTSTEEVFDIARRGSNPPRDIIEFIPCARLILWIEWVPVDAGGGFVAAFPADDERARQLLVEQGQFKKLDTGVGTELVQTFQVYVLYGRPGFTIDTARRAVLGFTSTKIPVYQSFRERADNIRYGGRKPALWAHRWHLTSVFEQRKKGDSWNYKITLAPPATPSNTMPAMVKKSNPLSEAGRTFADLVYGGKVEADYEKAGANSADPPF